MVEIMIVVAIIAILARLAIPAYRDYVVRGQLVPATNGLTQMRAQMEQYFQDNRTYVASGTYNPPCNTATTYGTFTMSACTLGTTACTVATAPCASPTTYTILVTGSGNTSGFSYVIDQNNGQYTTGLPSGWGTASTSSPIACWIAKRGGTC
jgi:type IV pilus assembly protein PilE